MMFIVISERADSEQKMVLQPYFFMRLVSGTIWR